KLAAIVGGTGAYRGARGEAVIVEGPHQTDTVTFSFTSCPDHRMPTTGEHAMKRSICHPTRARLAAALSLAAILLAAAVTAQAAPATTTAVTTAAPLPAQLNQLLRRFASAHPAFPGVALAVRTPTL